MINMRYISLFSFALILFVSCASSKKKRFTYFNNLTDDSVYVMKDIEKDVATLLQPGDIITIRVSTLDDKSTELFNNGVLNRVQGGSGSSSASSTLQTEGYRLDKNGDINFPVFGQINLKGKTLEDVQTILTQKISSQVKNPIVNVRLQNAIVTVIGEVKSPGPINISDRTVTVLEALGRAGDIQPTGRKDNVMLIRSNGVTKEIVRLNLNDISSTNSPYYFLQQGDIIVVDPTKVKERVVNGGFDKQSIVYLAVGSLTGVVSIITLVYTISQK